MFPVDTAKAPVSAIAGHAALMLAIPTVMVRFVFVKVDAQRAVVVGRSHGNSSFW